MAWAGFGGRQDWIGPLVRSRPAECQKRPPVGSLNSIFMQDDSDAADEPGLFRQCQWSHTARLNSGKLNLGLKMDAVKAQL